MANVSNFIKVTKAQYDILVNGGSITKDGTTYTYDNNALYLVEEDFSYLYNSGKFDTYPYNSDRSKVLRQTGYVDLGTLNWTWEANDLRWRTANKISDIYYTTAGSYVPEIVSAKYPTMSIQEQNASTSVIGITTYEGYIYLRNGSSTEKPSGVIQYHSTTTSYVEQVIENQPLLTLDQNGCNFLRQEWEKGLNLLKDSSNLTLSDSGKYFDVDFINGQTYTFSINGGNNTLAYALYIYNNNGEQVQTITAGTLTTNSYTFTCLVNNGTRLYVYCNNVNNANFMLNEGSHPYPYQAYNGAIVREKDLEPESIPQGTVNEALGYDTDGKLVRGTAGGGGSSKHTHYIEVIYNTDSNNRFRIYFTIVSDRDTPYTSFTEIYDYFNGLTTSTMRISANGDATVSQAVNHVSALSFVFAYSQIWLIGFSSGSDGILRQDLKSLTTFSDFTDIVD